MPEPVTDGSGDRLCHIHHEMEPSVLQNEVLHEPAHIYNADDVNVAHGRQTLVYTSSGKQRTAPHPDMTNVFGFAEAGVNGDNGRILVVFFYRSQRFRQVGSVHGFVQRAVNVDAFRTIGPDAATDERTKRISS